MRPHRWQPTRLPRPWDSLGKNTGVGCHFLLQCMKVKVKWLSRVRLLATPWTAALQAPPSMGFSRQEYWSGVPSPSPSFCLSLTKSVHCQSYLGQHLFSLSSVRLFHIFAIHLYSLLTLCVLSWDPLSCFFL